MRGHYFFQLDKFIEGFKDLLNEFLLVEGERVYDQRNQVFVLSEHLYSVGSLGEGVHCLNGEHFERLMLGAQALLKDRIELVK